MTNQRYNQRDRVIALAGVFQAAHLVQKTARQGKTDQEAMAGSIHSLFQLDPEDVPAVFATAEGIRLGLNILNQQFSGETRRDNEIIRYSLSLMLLERKLAGQPQELAKIRDDILQIQSRLDHYPEVHVNILAALANIYLENISSMRPRIIVPGEPVYLQNPEIVNRVRALLLAGIRAAMLWRQTGGRRLHLLWSRKSYVVVSRQLLDNL